MDGVVRRWKVVPTMGRGGTRAVLVVLLLAVLGKCRVNGNNLVQSICAGM